MPCPELFWSRYNGLGSQTQTPKCSKKLISGVSFRQRSLSQSQEGDVLSYSECKIAKNFQGFTPGPHWGGLTVLPQTPRLNNSFSPRYARWKTHAPKKLLDVALFSSEWWVIYWIFLFFKKSFSFLSQTKNKKKQQNIKKQTSSA